MMTLSHGRAMLILHICVLLWGFTAPLGKLITLNALELVWVRMSLAAVSFVPLLYILKQNGYLTRRVTLQLAGVGILVALHWLTFYGAIKLSNASVALVAFSTTSLFTSVIEPLMAARRPEWRQIVPALVVIPGIALLAQSLSLSMLLGLQVGLLSAFLCSVFGVLNKRLAHAAPAVALSLVEMLSGAVFLSMVLYFWQGLPAPGTVLSNKHDLLWMTILVLACTTLPFILSFLVLRRLSAFKAALALNLEPVYGVLLSFVFLKENQELPVGFYPGAALIVCAIVWHSWLERRYTPIAEEPVQAPA
jgi:drug/metabolite transporter (DMT)-like permease